VVSAGQYGVALDQLVYSFDTPDQGLTAEEVAPLAEALAAWTAGHAGSALIARTIDDVVVIRDRRHGWAPADHVLEDPREIAAWRALETGRAPHGVLAEQNRAWHPDDFGHWLGLLREAGLVFTDGRLWITLPTSPTVPRTTPLPLTVLTPSAVTTEASPRAGGFATRTPGKPS